MNGINNISDSLKDFNGVVLINKPVGTTSYDIIREIKKVFF